MIPGEPRDGACSTPSDSISSAANHGGANPQRVVCYCPAVMSTPSPPPGWYPDPSNPGQSIYWDGTKWTVHRASVPTSATQGVGRSNSDAVVKWVAGSVAAVVGLVIIFSSLGGKDSEPVDELHLPPVRDGKLEFTLLSWNGHAGKLRVVNIGDRSWSYAGDNQKAVDAGGREFDCDGETVSDIQPGQGIIDSLTCRNGEVAIHHLEVHDSWLSLGADLVLDPTLGDDPPSP